MIWPQLQAKEQMSKKLVNVGEMGYKKPSKSSHPMALGGLEGPHYETTPRGRLVRLKST